MAVGYNENGLHVLDSMNSRCKFLSILSVVLSAFGGAHGTTAANVSRGLLGTDLAAARSQSDYFEFFNLEPIAPIQVLPSGKITPFKPSGSDFRKLVTVYIETDANESIRGLRVVILRSFIDDPKNGVFARDLIKSSLIAPLDADDASRLHDLANEILYRNMKRTLLTGTNPTLSAAYLVVDGTNPAWSTTLRTVTLSLSNQTEEDQPVLVIEVKENRSQLGS